MNKLKKGMPKKTKTITIKPILKAANEADRISAPNQHKVPQRVEEAKKIKHKEVFGSLKSVKSVK